MYSAPPGTWSSPGPVSPPADSSSTVGWSTAKGKAKKALSLSQVLPLLSRLVISRWATPAGSR